MSNYVKASSWDKPARENAVFYAMEESDKNLIKSESNLAFGDIVYIISTKKIYIYGPNDDWEEM